MFNFYFPPDSLKHLVFDLLTVLELLVFVEALISCILCYTRKLSPFHPIVRGVRAIVNPVVGPIRNILPPYKTGHIDVSPMIAMILVQLIRSLFV